MTLRFSLPYRTTFGQRLAVCGSHPALGHWLLSAAPDLNYDNTTGCWSLEVEIPDTAPATLEYKYALLDTNTGVQQWEAGPNRRLAYDGRTNLRLADYWRVPGRPENELLTAAFTEALFRRPKRAEASGSATPAAGPKPTKGKKTAKTSAPNPETSGLQPGAVHFAIVAPRVPSHLGLCVLGSDPALGAWDNATCLVLSDADYPTWKGAATLQNPDVPCAYKYAMWDAAAGHALDMEDGENRWIPALETNEAGPVAAQTQPGSTVRIFNDEDYKYTTAWRGAGVALPVFAHAQHPAAWAWASSPT